MWERRAKVLARILAVLRPNIGLHTVVETVLQHIAATVGTAHAMIVVHDPSSQRIVRWDYRRPSTEHAPALTIAECRPQEWSTYFFETSTDTWAAATESWPAVPAADVPPAFRSIHPHDLLACIAFGAHASAAGRLFLLDPPADEAARADVAWLGEVLPHMGTALFCLARLRRMRRDAEVAERARLGRELHDGPIQGLLAMRLQVALLQRVVGSEQALDIVGDIDRTLHATSEQLRALSDRARVGAVPPTSAVPMLRQMVERFAGDTSIAADFQSDVVSLMVSARTAYEVVAIAREALVNIKRHSGATNVSVTLSRRDDGYCLRIDDNGRGFQGIGSETTVAPASSAGPGVIAERVRAIGGVLTLGSSPQGGARIEITITGDAGG
jgi:signal transduction histidine kinase